MMTDLDKAAIGRAVYSKKRGGFMKIGSKGASFIEAVISAAILSIISIPVVSGFSQAYKNYNFSFEYYKAGLHAQNILCAALYENEDINSILSDYTAYETDKYRYNVYVCLLQDGGVIGYTAYSSGGNPEDLTDLSFYDYSDIKYKAIDSENRLIIVDAYSKNDVLLVRILSL